MIILTTIDLAHSVDLNEIYSALASVKKERYEDNERIVIKHSHNSKTINVVKEIIDFLDISDYFVVFEAQDVPDQFDFEFSNSHCIYPWINLLIDNQGTIKPCCMYKEQIANITKDNIKDVYHSSYMKQLRQKFLQGERPTQCSSCWKNESAGVPSHRQNARFKFREIYYRLNYLKDDFKNLQIFDLKLGNSCNLSCRICNKESSVKIAEAELESGKISTVEFNRLSAAVKWSESEQFWEQMLSTVENLRYLDLYGGEPLISKRHFRFLEKLVSLDVAKNIKIDYNTNGTVYSEKFFDLWQHFKEVKLSFSIDDIEHRFEDQRCGAVWKTVCDNIHQFNSKRSDKFITEVFPTINTQNVYWLPELLEWISTQEFDHISFNILEFPSWYNIQSLDDLEKQTIIAKLKNYQEYDIINSVIKLLNVAKTSH